MRTKLMIVLSVLVLAVLNYGIYEKEQIKANGDVVLLELVPVDPRSLMQGDYMQLRYAIESAVPVKDLQDTQQQGTMVIKPDDKNVAQFVRLHDGEALAPSEYVIKFRKRGKRAVIVPDSFFFQEGHGAAYEQAKYGVFKFDQAGNHLLVGLADEHGKTITVPEPDNGPRAKD